MAGPLTGKTIIEVGHMLAGPYCGMLLTDLGARIIKVETPQGDIARSVGPNYVGEHNTYFASLNRGKESVVLDLASVEGQRDLFRLVKEADGLITNLRPSAIKKLGLTYPDLQRANPRIACLALTGYGLNGPFAESPAYDYVIQAMAGIMLLTGNPDGPPVKPGYSAVDNSAGIMGAVGLLAQMLSGRGGQVDVSMYDTMLSQLNYLGSAYLNAGERTQRIPDGGHPYIVPAQLFDTLDGYLVMFITHDRFWRLFAEALGEHDWMVDPRLATMSGRAANRHFVVEGISRRLKERSAQEWVTLLAPLGLVVACVQSLPEALESALTASRNMVVDIPVGEETLRLIGNPIKVDGLPSTYPAPPCLGANNDLLARLHEVGD